MQADLSALEIGVRVACLVLFALNLATYFAFTRWVPLLSGKLARRIYLALLAIFNLPLFAYLIGGHHVPELLPNELVALLFHPAFAWHFTHVWLLIVALLIGTVLGPWRLVRPIVRRVRRQKPKKRKKVPTTRREFLKNATLAGPALLFGLWTYGALTGERLVLRRLDIALERLPEGFDSLKIVHLSDLHLGGYIRLTDLEGMVGLINTLTPDLVVITGDICDQHDLLSETAGLLGRIKSRLGVFACMGNHEYLLPIDDVREAFDPHITFLVDESTVLSKDGGELILAGLDYAFRRGQFGLPRSTNRQHIASTFEGLDRGGRPIICLAHSPRAFDELTERDVDLVLAGHTHGGQIVFWGRSDGESGSGPRINGLYSKGASKLYVTAGAGHWMPLRLSCPREIALITLRRKHG